MQFELQVKMVMNQFQTGSEFASVEPYELLGIPHESFLVTLKNGSKIVMQRLCSRGYPHPVAMMENVTKVCEHMRAQIEKRGGVVSREVINPIKNKRGGYCYRDSTEQYWRGFWAISDSKPSKDSPTTFTAHDLGEQAGKFMRLGAGFPLRQMPDLYNGTQHDTRANMKRLKAAIEANPCKRAGKVRREIEFASVRAQECGELYDLQKRGILPLRLTNNELCVENMLFDSRKRTALCLVSLDRICAGISAYDFGDAIRSCASSVSVDEEDQNKIYLRTELVESFTNGYFISCGRVLGKAEVESLPYGVKTMTYERGLRYLIDYINGDVEFAVKNPEQNLIRACNQFRLVQNIERKWGTIESIVQKQSIEFSQSVDGRFLKEK